MYFFVPTNEDNFLLTYIVSVTDHESRPKFEAPHPSWEL